MKILIEFTEPLLGTLAGNKELAEDFIITKHLKQHPRSEAEQSEEMEAIPEKIEKSSTVFSRNGDNVPILWDYQIKGFFKDACLAMIGTETLTKEILKSSQLTQYLYKRTIDHHIFVFPRKIVLQLPKGTETSFCERPLRANTMKGERIALARSEQAPAGTTIEIEIRTLNKKLMPFIERWLDYGALRGLGQWRNASYGRFRWSQECAKAKHSKAV